MSTASRSAAPALGADGAAGNGPAFALPLAIGVTVLAWASAFVVIRAVGETLSPGPLALVRLLVGAAALGLFQLRRSWVRPTGREWAFLAAFGVLWFGGYNILLNFAELTLDAGTASMVVNIGPILLGLGAALVLGERLSRPLVVGAAVSFVGVLVIGLSTGAGGVDDTVGVLAALAAAVVYAGGVLFQKPVLARLPAVQVTFLGAVVGAVVCLPFAPGLVTELAVASPGAVAGAVYLGLVPTALAFSTWAYALQRMPAARLGVTTYLVPPIAILLALVAFGEVPGPLAILGGILCLGGVALSRRR
ncbi:DMT family transporter [Naasia sp. SYSU D00948]|uniref:DMT family transporter n=1 Tax=Naasia sp. SYSU D00948 TaxID=2817379 RepID=UPI0027DCBD4B|nr:DMT family transporter [Naasia sp. SYSU D00948]